ncbi:MAG: cysteine desulfurase family protein [Patescibacteria group bacterium]
MKRIYLDHAAATPLNARVRKAIIKVLGVAGNPSSYNNAGREAAMMLEEARQTVARFLGAHSDEIVFTSSGSEANALAILGVMNGFKKERILTTPIEHLSVLESIKAVVSGGEVSMIAVNEKGEVELKDIREKLTSTTILVSVMYANNEIGTIQPIAQIGKMIREFRRKYKVSFPLFHVDACQATEYLDMNVQHLGVDFLTFNGSKIYGPRGTGVLYVRRGVTLQSLIRGGGQEQGLRAGTENVPACIGLAEALECIPKQEKARLTLLRDYFFTQLKACLPDVRINGSLGDDRLPNNVNISIPGLDSENLLLELDAAGISAGSGSACTARSVEPSHVLKAIGVKKPYLDGALRFSMGRATTKKDIDYVLQKLPLIIKKLHKRYQK